jgi:hypothetical protein
LAIGVNSEDVILLRETIKSSVGSHFEEAKLNKYYIIRE